MARFDRQDIEASRDSGSLDDATGRLESFVEQKVREIIDAAVDRAAQIEREAAERAQEVQSRAEHRSKEMLEEAFTRAWRILDGIDLLENGVGDMIGALRTEMESFAADLGSAVPPADPAEPRAADAPGDPLSAHRNGAGGPHGRAPLTNALQGAPGVKGIAEHHGDHAEVEQMIIEQVAILRRDGSSRADAERFVLRFKQGEDYLHVLDRIYTEDGEGPPAPQPSTPPAQRARWGFRARRD